MGRKKDVEDEPAEEPVEELSLEDRVKNIEDVLSHNLGLLLIHPVPPKAQEVK